MALPVVDLSPLVQEPRDEAAVSRLAAAVDEACRQTGFLYITGPGTADRDIARLLQLARLFDLPQGVKDSLDATKSPLFRGYNSLAHGKHSCTPEDGKADAKESFTVGMDRAAGDPRPASPMHGPNQWPPAQLLPGWQEEAEAALGGMLGAARLLMRALALALRQPEDFFTSKCEDPVSQMVFFRYPPTPSGPPARGCGAHTDCGFLTFVAQDAPGIEVRLPDGSWLTAPSLPGTLLVNLGDLAQRWTGDVYRSTEHRVVNRSPTLVLLIVVLLASNMIIYDGVLTPAISVVGAIEGIQFQTGISRGAITGISMGILVLLFSMQSFGTEKVAFLFSPLMVLWFFCNAALGIYNISRFGGGSIFSALVLEGDTWQLWASAFVALARRLLAQFGSCPSH